jgi:predicted membrane chloride channel (bestrophin family)
MNKHLRSLSVIFFIAAYGTAMAMYFEEALFLKLGGVALGIFLTFQLIEKFENK